MTHKRGPAWSCNVNDRIRKYKLGYFPILILIISQTGSYQSTFKKEAMLDRNYQDDNKLYSNHGLAYGFNDLDFVAIDT